MITNATQFGKIKFEGRDLPPQPATYDRIAIGPKKELLYISLVAETNFVKAIRAILGAGSKAHITATEGKVKVPGNPHSVAAEPGKLERAEGGYEFHQVKLDHGLVHAAFVARTEGFMLNVTDATLLSQLLDDRYTTPFLPEWMPYIKVQMLKGGLLSMLECMGCECGMITTTNDQFDFIVTHGIKAGKIRVPGS